MTLNKRAEALAAAARKKQENSNFTAPVAPTMPIGDDSNTQASIIRAKGFASRLQEQLDRTGMDMVAFLNSHMGIVLPEAGSPQRLVKTPNGSVYVAVSTKLTHSDLVDKCVVDPDNVRHESERTEEALEWLIDEIRNEYQLQPAIAYVNDDGLISFVDGSLRRSAAIFGGASLYVDILDKKPTIEDIHWMVDTSDRKKVFSYFDKGKLYSNIMSSQNWSQKDLCIHRKYSKTDVSRAVQFYRDTPDSIKAILSLKDCTSAELNVLNPNLALIVKHNQVDELVSSIPKEDVGQNKKIVAHVKQWAEKIKNPKKRKADPVSIYKSGKTDIQLHSVSKTKWKLELSNVEVEDKEMILSLISNYFDNKSS